MNKVYYIIVCLLFPITVLANPKTVYLTNGEFPPYLSQHLPDYGYASKIVSEAFAAVGYEVKYQFFPWKRSYLYAQRGYGAQRLKWHGTVVWIYNEERASDFLFSDVVIEDNEVLFHLKNKPLKLKSIEDLYGLTVGVNSHAIYPYLDEAERNNKIKVEHAGTYEVLFKRLLAGRIDTIPHVKKVASYLLANNLTPEEQQQITFSHQVFYRRKYHLMLSKNVANNNELLKEFNKGLKIIQSNGVLNQINNDFNRGKYFKTIQMR